MPLLAALFAGIGMVALMLALPSCGQGNSGDESDAGPINGPDAFLLFPNPLVRADATLEMKRFAHHDVGHRSKYTVTDSCRPGAKPDHAAGTADRPLCTGRGK